MISYYLTQTGKNLLAGLTKGLTDITFDSIRLGGGQAADPVNSTALADEKLILSNPEVEQNANDDNVVTVSVNVSSADITTSFVCSELGLYADDVLLMVAHDDHPITIPNKTVANPVMLTYSFNLIMSSTADTAIAIAPSGLVFIKQLNEHKTDTAAHVDTLKAVIDDSKVPAADTNEIRELLSNIAAMIKAQTGKSDWKANPSIDINTLNSKITGVTVDQTRTPAGDTGLDVDTAVSGLANRELLVIGGTDWKDTPEITLKEATRLLSAIADNNDIVFTTSTANIDTNTVTLNKYVNPYMPVVVFTSARTNFVEVHVSLVDIHGDNTEFSHIDFGSCSFHTSPRILNVTRAITSTKKETHIGGAEYPPYAPGVPGVPHTIQGGTSMLTSINAIQNQIAGTMSTNLQGIGGLFYVCLPIED